MPNCNMKDDPEFNIKFVSVVEHFPCVYDYTRSDYSKRNVVDNAWEKIAKEISESVPDCKERWKNLRACYSRHLKSLNHTLGFECKARRPYYLAEYLNFLQPYTKSRKLKGIYKVPQSIISSSEEKQETEHEITNKSEERKLDPLSEHGLSHSVGHKLLQAENFGSYISKKDEKCKSNFKKNYVTLGDANKFTYDCSQSKTSSTKEEKLENPDLDFLKSILPDMNEMTSDQKRRFKIGILNLAGQILTEDKTVLPQASFTVSLRG